jgi:hypothetical protein
MSAIANLLLDSYYRDRSKDANPCDYQMLWSNMRGVNKSFCGQRFYMKPSWLSFPVTATTDTGIPVINEPYIFLSIESVNSRTAAFPIVTNNTATNVSRAVFTFPLPQSTSATPFLMMHCSDQVQQFFFEEQNPINVKFLHRDGTVITFADAAIPANPTSAVQNSFSLKFWRD